MREDIEPIRLDFHSFHMTGVTFGEARKMCEQEVADTALRICYGLDIDQRAR
jgi:hypothetical protein